MASPQERRRADRTRLVVLSRPRPLGGPILSRVQAIEGGQELGRRCAEFPLGQEVRLRRLHAVSW